MQTGVNRGVNSSILEYTRDLNSNVNLFLHNQAGESAEMGIIIKIL